MIPADRHDPSGMQARIAGPTVGVRFDRLRITRRTPSSVFNTPFTLGALGRLIVAAPTDERPNGVRRAHGWPSHGSCDGNSNGDGTQNQVDLQGADECVGDG
ncbi:MAG: hypothetical protein D6725_16215 [Planctomycetota bacterium]|nr:MAG: hypothetical protein D6725_16215 [Planctomycetota bacterium]